LLRKTVFTQSFKHSGNVHKSWIKTINHESSYYSLTALGEQHPKSKLFQEFFYFIFHAAKGKKLIIDHLGF
jgi:protein associated with RNAse G/E